MLEVEDWDSVEEPNEKPDFPSASLNENAPFSAPKLLEVALILPKLGFAAVEPKPPPLLGNLKPPVVGWTVMETSIC